MAAGISAYFALLYDARADVFDAGPVVRIRSHNIVNRASGDVLHRCLALQHCDGGLVVQGVPEVTRSVASTEVVRGPKQGCLSSSVQDGLPGPSVTSPAARKRAPPARKRNQIWSPSGRPDKLLKLGG